MKTCFTFLLALLVLGSAAQSMGSVKGRIMDDSGNPLPFANVSINQGTIDLATATDLDGRFVLKPLPSGTYALSVTSVGYKDLLIQNVLVGERLAILPEHTMTATTLDIGGVEIVWLEKPLIDVDQPSMKTILASEIKHSPAAKNTAQLVASVNSDVIVETNASGATELFFRGSRSGNNVYFIDGMKLYGNMPSMPSAGIGRMDVYTGGVPAKYGDFTGGVVVIETRSYNEVWRKLEARRLAAEAMLENSSSVAPAPEASEATDPATPDTAAPDASDSDKTPEPTEK